MLTDTKNFLAGCVPDDGSALKKDVTCTVTSSESDTAERACSPLAHIINMMKKKGEEI